MTSVAQSYWQAELSRIAEVMTLAKNESLQVGMMFEAQVELSRSAEGIIPAPWGRIRV
jgi:hypothetical protein